MFVLLEKNVTINDRHEEQQNKTKQSNPIQSKSMVIIQTVSHIYEFIGSSSF
jgi:hypothetical protein